MALLDDIKTQLGVNGSARDTDITLLIDSAVIDLKEAGVLTVTSSTTDAFIKQAIRLYAVGHFGYDVDAADATTKQRCLEEYERHKARLGTCADYNQFKVTFTVKTGTTPIRNAVITIDDEEGTVLYTDSTGVACYYVYAIQDVDYTVAATGYTNVTSSVYVDGNEAVAVAMT